MTCFMLGLETLHGYCKRTGLNYQTMWIRLNQGLTPEQAIKSHVNRKCNLKYLINGKSARSQMDINTYQRYVKRQKERTMIEEEDLYLTWEEFHKKHPSVDKWEWEQKQKELQEV